MNFSGNRRQKKIAGIFLVGLALLVTGLGVFSYIYGNRCFEHYRVESKVERSDSNNVSYQFHNGNILKFSRSGISEIDNSGKSLWNGGYEMKRPQVDISGDYVVVADVDGKIFYVFNGKDEGISIETNLPIVRAKVSEQGIVAVLLKDKDSNVLNLYNPYVPAGKLLVEIPTNVAEEGYPIDFDVSPDGKSVVTSHLVVTGNNIDNKVSFYNFTEVGQDKNTLVGGKSFGEEMVAKIEFADDDRVVVFREKGCTVFKEMRQPDVAAEMNFADEIKSMAFDGDTIAAVTAKEGKLDSQKLFLYDSRGKEKLQQNISCEYDDMQIYGNEIIFVGNRVCNIMRANGHEKFKYRFQQEIDAIFPTSDSNEYTLIDNLAIHKISLSS